MLPVNQPLLNGDEKKLLAQCIESGWISSDGPFIKEFEEKFASYIGASYAVAVANGTAALEAAMYAIGICPGDEVIMPSFTIISCAVAVMRFGGKPVLIEIEPETWNIDVKQIEAKITSRTKAIMAVHMYGHPCDLDPILEIAGRHGLMVIEDASQVHGALYKGNKCGSIGHISTFSFYANKLITTGEGGMVMTSDKNLADRASSYRNLCFREERRFYHTDLGNNLRMTNMQGALGVAQLSRLDEFVEIKRANGVRYVEQLNQLQGIKTQTEKPWARMVYWMYCLELDPSSGLDAEKMMGILKKRGVGTRPFFLGLHEQPILQKKGWYKDEVFPITERAARQGLYLPSGLDLKHSDIDYVVEQVADILKHSPSFI
jgi:perosamine synthetase